MKSFLLSMALFALMLFLIAWNFVYVNRTAETLLDMIDALPSDPDDSALAPAEALSDFWHAKTDSIGFSVGYTVLDRISEQAETLVATAKYHDFFDYQLAKELLRDAVRDMRRLEQFSVGNLL